MFFSAVTIWLTWLLSMKSSTAVLFLISVVWNPAIKFQTGIPIGRFRNLLIKNKLQDKLFQAVVDRMKAKGLLLMKGTIVDSTLVVAPSSTKNKEKCRDKDAHQTKKGNQWYFGYKGHIGVDRDTGIVHHLKATATNVHDVVPVPKLLNGTEEEFFADSGYLGA